MDRELDASQREHVAEQYRILKTTPDRLLGRAADLDAHDTEITTEQGFALLGLYHQNEATQAAAQARGFTPADESRILPPAEIGPHFIDNCAVYRGVLAADGWAQAGAPAVLYQGRPVQTHAFASQRPDLVPHFGEGTEGWGFSIRAVIGQGGIEHDQISLLFPNGARLDAPGRKFAPNNDHLDRMLERFRVATEAGGRVLEIGSRARSGNTYRQYVSENAEYVGLDVTDGPNVHVVGDAHHLSRHAPGPFDFIFSISVFEHLLMPWKVALEMNTVMRMGGLAFIQSHPAWPLHEEPWDFWRFSENAWEGLFNKHTGFRMLDKGYALPAALVPHHATGGHMQGHEGARLFMLSGCLVEKVGDPAPGVAWEAEASEVYNLAYDHA